MFPAVFIFTTCLFVFSFISNPIHAQSTAFLKNDFFLTIHNKIKFNFKLRRILFPDYQNFDDFMNFFLWFFHSHLYDVQLYTVFRIGL